MKILSIFIIIAFLFPLALLGQITKIEGSITDPLTNEFIIGAPVILNDGAYLTTTNTTGRY